MAKGFPVVRLPEGNVYIYGLFHGHDKQHRLPSQVKDALGREVSRFRANDYFLVEGTPYVIIGRGYKTSSLFYIIVPEKFQLPVESNRVLGALSQVPQFRTIPHLNGRTELLEWYFDTILTNPQVDSKIDEHIRTLTTSEPREESVTYENVTLVEPEDVRAIKQRLFTILDGQIEGISREELGLHLEKRFTVRSLLMSRVSAYRTRALHGDVRLFIGCTHSGEARRFSKNPRERERYLANAHELIRHVYEENEAMQDKITTRFLGIESEIKPQERPYALRQVVVRTLEEDAANRGPLVLQNFFTG